MGKLRVASLFAGIGGIDLGFKNAGFSCVWANDIDEHCKITYDANHQNKMCCKSIINVVAGDIGDITVLAGGFPCQAFSIAGHRKGFEDDRGILFFEIARLLEEMKEQNKLPKAIFLENVKNLKTHNGGDTLAAIKGRLTDIGYKIDEKILNASEYGNLPQCRERIYIVGFLYEEDAKNFQWPDKIELTNTFNNIVNRDLTVADKYYYEAGKTKYYPMFRTEITNPNSIYQLRRVYIRENKSGVCPTLTANMGMGGHNVPIILDNNNRIRKLTPRECLNIQGFPEDFIIPPQLADSVIYKQAGNSVAVSVVECIAAEMFKVLSK